MSFEQYIRTLKEVDFMIRIYKINADRKSEVKKILETPDHVENGKMVINEFARNGYEFRDASGLGLNEDAAYLYIDADESFFERNEKLIMLEGVKKLEGEEFNKIKDIFEQQSNSVAAGVGAIFGDM